MPVGLAARRADRVERIQRRAGPFDLGELPLDRLGRRALATVLDAVGQLALEPVPIGDELGEVRIARVGLLDQIEQMEGAAGCRGQVGGDRRNDAAGGSGDAEDGVRSQRPLRVGLGRPLHEPHPPAQLVGVADLDRAGIAQGLLDQEVRERRRPAAGREVDGLHQRLGALTRE